MKAKIIVTDDSGNTFEHELELVAKRGPAPASKGGKAEVPKARSATPHTVRAEPEVDLSLPVRPFIKRHGAHMSGTHLFALLLAHMARGDTTKEVARTDLEAQWNKMTQLMGMAFHHSFGTRAADNGWVQSARRGHYNLLPGWKGALENA